MWAYEMKFARLCACLTGGRPLVSLDLTLLFFLALTLKYCMKFTANEIVILSWTMIKKKKKREWSTR